MSRKITEEIITRFKLEDTKGNRHVASGVLTYEAKTLVFVCFDDYESIGGRIWFFTMSSVVARIMSLVNAGVMPKSGSLGPTAEVLDTGAGYCLCPYDERLEVKHVVEFDPSKCRSDAHDIGIKLVTAELESHGYRLRRATLQEEYRGIDLTAYRDDEVATFEVKTRRKNQGHWRLYFQISETNPTKRFN